MSQSLPTPLKDQIGKGGFALIFRDPRNPRLTCIKRLNNPVTGPRADQLRRLAEVDLWARPSEAELLKSRFSWPLEIFGDASQVVGFTMPLAPDDAFITLRAAGREKVALLEVSFLTVKDYFNKAAVTSTAPDFGDQDRIELCISICDAILALHEHRLVYRDVSARNMAARLTEPRSAFILDADSIVDIDTAQGEIINSAGWQVDPAFGPLETDRAKLALLVLRLLARNNDARPPHGLEELVKHGRRAVAEAIERTYREGSADAIEEMVVCLRRARSAERNRYAWEAAVSSGYARRVVREGSAASSPADYELLRQAQAHVNAELELEAFDLKSQRKLISRLQRTSPFSIDTLPTVGMVPIPRTAEELNQLAFDAQFVDIAIHLMKSGLPHLRTHPFLPAVADRVAFEADRPRISSRTRPGAATVILDWPKSFFCNAIEISTDSGGGPTASETITRDPTSARVEREIRMSAGGRVRILLRVGICTPQGEILLSANYLVHLDIDIPPTPKPPRPPVSRPPVAVGQAVVVDPEEEERQLIELERLRKRKKLRRVLLTIAALVLAGGAFATWKALQPPEPPAPPTYFIQRY